MSEQSQKCEKKKVRVKVQKWVVNADLAAARAEAHEEWTEEAAMLALKRLEEANMDVDWTFANGLWNFVLAFTK